MQRPLIVALAVLMCAPSIMSALSGALAIDELCLRLAVAFVLSYAGVRLVSRLIISYASSSSQWAAPPQDDEDATP